MTPAQKAEMAADLTDKPTSKKAAVSAQLVALAQEQASFIRGEVQTLNKLSRNLRQLGVTVATGGRSNGRRYIDVSLTDPTQYVSLRRPPAWHPPAVRPPLTPAAEGQDALAPAEEPTEGTGSPEGHLGPGQ